MMKKCLFLYLVALIVIIGCIELQQTQTEKVGWEQAKYEEYSAFYGDLVNYTSDTSWSGKSLEEVLIDIPKDKNEFEKTWYLTFYYIKKARDTRRPDERLCTESFQGSAMMIQRQECLQGQTATYRNVLNQSYTKAAEYRQKIEDMKMNFSR